MAAVALAQPKRRRTAVWAMAGLFVASFVSVGSGAAKGALMASASLAGGGITLQAPTRTEPYRFFHIDGGFYKVKNTSCPVPWEWTNDQESADAVFYHALQSHPRSNIPRARLNQTIVFFTLESGNSRPFMYEAKERGYNITIDYRIWPDHPRGPADVPAVYLFNFLVDSDSRTAPRDLREPPQLPKRKEGALVAAFVSNCGPRNGRNVLMRELIQAGMLDSYGSCMRNKPEPPDTSNGTRSRRDVKLEVAGEYPFILTAENSDEPGYVTEKVYQGLEAGSVPIYLGAPDVDRFVPHPSSIINAADFNSTADLVAHLRELAADEARYMKHFEWKQREFTDDFKRVAALAERTENCRLALHLEGLPME